MENVFTGDFFYPAHRCLATEEKCLACGHACLCPPQAGKNLGFFALLSAQMSRNHSAVARRSIDSPDIINYVAKNGQQKMLFCYSDPKFGDFSKVWTPVFGEGGGWAAHPFYFGGRKYILYTNL